MYLDVTPLIHISRPGPKTLTYRYHTLIPEGSLVRIPLRKKFVLGIVESIAHSKKFRFVPKPIAEVISTKELIPKSLRELIQELAEFYVVSSGLFLKTILPSYLVRNPHRIGALLEHAILAPWQNEPRLSRAPITHACGPHRLAHYYRAIASTLKKKKSVLFLVPDTARIPDIEEKLRSRFPAIRLIPIPHSFATKKAALLWFELMALDEPAIIVASRKGVFLPIKNLGLFVLEDEGSDLWKNDLEHPKYHSGDIARRIAEKRDIRLIVGDTMPSLQSVQEEAAHLLSKLHAPKINIVNLRDAEERTALHRTRGISMTLAEHMQRALAHNKKVLLFVNRIGMGTAVMCRDCDFVIVCTKCSAPLVVHQEAIPQNLHPTQPSKTQEGKILRCRHCGMEQPLPYNCPSCHSWRIRPLGIGTELIAETLKKIFPDVPIGRLDREATSSRKRISSVLQDFHTKKIKILIATQAIMHKPVYDVGLVGIAALEQLFARPEFHAEESALKTVVQLGETMAKDGIMDIQTFSPKNQLLEALMQHNIARFLKKELQLRRQFHYPPFWNLIKLSYGHRDQARAREQAEYIGTVLAKALKNSGVPRSHIEIIGPLPAFIQKLKGTWRWNIVIKIKNPPPRRGRQKSRPTTVGRGSPQAAKIKMHDLKKILWEKVPADWDIDVDPKSIL